MDSLTVNNITYPVKIYYEHRKTFRVSIGKKAINIRIPKSAPKSRQDTQINKFLNWAQEKIKNSPESFIRQEDKKYKNGNAIKIMNQEYVIKLTYKMKKTGSAKIINNNIILSLPEGISKKEESKIIPKAISKSVAAYYLPALEKLIYDLNKKHFNYSIGKICFKYNKSNWGSCSPKNNININTRLLLAPESVLQYVCIHELAHIRVRNHSGKFWAHVKKAMPDYKEKQQWLKSNRNKCWF